MPLSTLKQLITSEFAARSGITVQVSDGGETTGRDDFNGEMPMTFSPAYLVNESDKDSLISDFNAKRRTDFLFTDQRDDYQYLVVWVTPPGPEPIGSNLYRVTCQLELVLIRTLGTGDGFALGTGDGFILRLN